VYPGRQTSAQVPETQTGIAFGPAVQALPHALQWRGSFMIEVQMPSQAVRPGPHDSWQIPLLQTSPASQALPQVPQ
jgi:hypothetical protein